MWWEKTDWINEEGCDMIDQYMTTRCSVITNYNCHALLHLFKIFVHKKL